MVDWYKDGSLIAMFDCIGSISNAIGDGLQSPELIEIVLRVLNKKWEQFSNSDRSLLTLFECFESVVVAVGDAIEPYAKIIFDRCVIILSNVLNNINENFENLYNETDFYIRSMDLMSSIFTALNEKAHIVVS